MVEVGAALLYQVTVDNSLAITVDPANPKRGQSAFETDLAVFDERREDVRLPRRVIEFKVRLTTHDILTYSTKAQKHSRYTPTCDMAY